MTRFLIFLDLVIAVVATIAGWFALIKGDPAHVWCAYWAFGAVAAQHASERVENLDR